MKTVDAGGTVRYNGQPVEGATVTFFPADPNSGKPAGGTTDAAGKFTLQTAEGGQKMAKGALVGDYKVAIAKDKKSGVGTDPSAGFDATKMTMETAPDVGGGVADGDPTKVVQAKTTESELPAKYADKETSEFTASVPAGGKSNFTFELTD